MFEDVHPRRMMFTFSPFTLDNLEYAPKPGQVEMGRFEYYYGYPTDIDKVWAERDKLQNETRTLRN